MTINQVQIEGTLTAVDFDQTKNGKDLARITIEVDAPGWKGGGKESVYATAFSRSATRCKELGSGQLVSVTGRLSCRTFEGRDGKPRPITEVIVDDIKPVDAPF